jgi:hypothetical protein
MSVLLPGNRDWITGQWVSMGFFQDALEVAPPDPEFRPDISRFVEIDFRTLDLSRKPVETLRRFADLVDAVIAYNERLKGSDFQQREIFFAYAAQLQALKRAVSRVTVGCGG